MWCNVHGIELAEVNGNHVKVILHVTTKGLYARTITLGLLYGSEKRLNERTVVKIDKLNSGAIPSASI
ncbi:MAG: hypothetical protein WA021_01340, partial [Minisyncoccia bacterium]